VGIAPNAKIIDKADGSALPISPLPKMIYAIAIIFGFMIPFGIISVVSFFDNKIHTIDDLESMLNIPILGDIPEFKSNQKIINFANDKNDAAEGFRILRTNLDFMFSNAVDDSKTIFVTSTIAGEGKTFIAINLASSLVASGKRVLLVGADLRLPKFNEYFSFKFNKGLTEYLVDTNLHASDIVNHDKKTGLNVVNSGAIPPNPADLLMNKRFGEVIAYAKENYDFIIVDTPPIKLVTDTMLISKFADLTIYVTRADYIDKRLLKIPMKIFENNRLSNMAILLNATNYKKSGYGYGYGYG